MFPSLLQTAFRPPQQQITLLVSRLLVVCLDVRSVWSMDHDPSDAWASRPAYRLLAFADRAALERLRKCDYLHTSDVEVMMVVNGDSFESAWEPARPPGSLARSAWRRVSADEAYYDESRWARSGNPEHVVRVRRKAFLVWQAADAE